jgi:hypothetical protein
MKNKNIPIFTDYIPPKYGLDGFHCPNPKCGVYSRQVWFFSSKLHTLPDYHGQVINDQSLDFAKCERCEELSVWKDSKLIYPLAFQAPPPNKKMPSEILIDYEEARTILPFSPRGSAALLRLATEKLVRFLVIKSGKDKAGDLNEKIGILVSDGMPVTIQKALDSLRVIGNAAVHPGLLDLKDDFQTATKLFKLVNVIVENRIAEIEEIESLYDEKIADEKKLQIEKRDNAN